MNWYTSEMCQERANRTRKSVCAWAPKPYPHDGTDKMRWLISAHASVKDFRNNDPNFLETDPWEDRSCYRRLFRPEKM